MVSYNPKDWWKLIFYFRKSDTVRKLGPSMMGVMLYTALFYYLENKILHLMPIKNPIAVHSLVGFVLSLLLVFRTNTAYDRWWEGRKIWGSFTNNSRNLGMKLKSYLAQNSDALEFFRIQIGNYVMAAKYRLRSGDALNHLDFIENFDANFYQKKEHLPNAIGQTMYDKINMLYKNGSITGHQLLALNQEIASFADNMGGCERIKNTPIPVSYNIFIKKMIFIYVFTMPISFVLEFGFWAIPIVTLVFFAFAAIEIIAEEIEDPFGKDSNDLALDSIVKNIKANLAEIMAQ
jgi:ion channel-forming bestrophin family protein